MLLIFLIHCYCKNFLIFYLKFNSIISKINSNLLNQMKLDDHFHIFIAKLNFVLHLMIYLFVSNNHLNYSLFHLFDLD